MKSSSELFELIHSLNKTEKRYFKLHVAKYNYAESNYLKLFDALDRQEAYDEKAIRKYFQKETFVLQLNVTKKYLFKLIMKSLNAFHADMSVNSRLNEMLINVEVLYDKGLFIPLQNILTKAKNIAVRYEKFPQLLEIIRWEKRMMSAKDFKGTNANKARLLIAEERSIFEKLTNHSNYWEIASSVSLINQKDPRQSASIVLIPSVL